MKRFRYDESIRCIVLANCHTFIILHEVYGFRITKPNYWAVSSVTNDPCYQEIANLSTTCF
jgi:hypothetical protein